jgi:hypothetical protein
MGCWGIQTLPLATIAKVHSSKHLVAIIFGREICSNLEIAQSREWFSITAGDSKSCAKELAWKLILQW